MIPQAPLVRAHVYWLVLPLLSFLSSANALSDPKCPVVESLGIIPLPFNAAFLAAEELDGGDQCLFITSFVNLVSGYPDLVASICGLDLLEEELSYDSAAVAEVLTDVKTVWPNEAILAPEGVFPFQALVIPQGFHPAPLPGRLTAINLDVPDKTEYVIHQSTQSPEGFTGFTFPGGPDNEPRYYHDAQFFDMDGDGYKDIISVRSGFRVRPSFYPPIGELVWFKNPGPEALDPTVEWTETVLFGGPLDGFLGPDIFVKMHDFNGDGVPEFVATHSFTGPGNPTSPDSGKITLYAAPVGEDWSNVNALDPSAPQVQVKDLTTDQGSPFGIEIVDLNGDGKVDILCTNHQPDNISFPSDIPGRIFALEQPPSGDFLSDDWVSHVLLDNIRPNPSLGPSPPGRLAPGAASAIYPFPGNDKQTGLRPWIVAGGDEASKVWLLRPEEDDWKYESAVIFDINEYYGPDTTQTPFGPGVTISTIGKVIASDSFETEGDLLIYVPVFEAGEIHVFRLSSDCDSEKNLFD